jgi:hypothetical protein
MLTDPVTIIMLILGIVIHQLLTMAKQNKEQGGGMNPKEYFLAHPYATTSTVLLSVAGFFMLHGVDQLTHVTALGMGFMSDSVGNTVNQLTKGTNLNPPKPED